MGDRKIKIGVFGAGHLGRIHIRLLLELSDLFELVGFYDPSDESAEKTITEFNVQRWDDMQALIDASDCLDVVAPTLYHYDIAYKAIRSSKHVFIEKPLAETTEQAKILLDLSREAGVIVQVGHVERFNPAFRAAEPLIVKPMFYEIHRLAQYNPRGTDVSVILDLMIHDLDIVLSTVNSSIRRISASGVSHVDALPPGGRPDDAGPTRGAGRHPGRDGAQARCHQRTAHAQQRQDAGKPQPPGGGYDVGQGHARQAGTHPGAVVDGAVACQVGVLGE